MYNVKIPISIIFVPRELRQIDVQQLNGKITSKYIIIRLVLCLRFLPVNVNNKMLNHLHLKVPRQVQY